MSSVQQSGSTSGTKWPIGVKHPTISARNLVAAVMAIAKKTVGEAGAKLFGVANPFRTTFYGQAVVGDGNVAQFLKDRIERFGIEGVRLPSQVGSLSDAIVNVARQLAERVGTTAGLSAQQLIRIAIEYVTQACCIDETAIEPFSAYLARAKQYRTAMKTLNRTEQASNPEAFSSASDPSTIEKVLEQGRQAWASATRYLAESVHLAALRTQIDAPILFTGIEAWQAVKALNADVRLAVLNELRAAMQQSGKPYVNTAAVEQALARVAGNQFLTGGNLHGVTIDTAIEAMASSRMPGVQPNGGAQVGFDGTPAFAVGDALRGLNAHVRGTAKRKDGRTIGYEFDVTEGPSSSAPFTTPIALPTSGRQASLHASA